MADGAGNLLARDLDHVLEHTLPVWDALRGERIFLTGGTGFFGCWLLESLAWANARHGANTQVVVLTRDPAAFARKAPHLAANPHIDLHRGDARNFDFTDGTFSHVLHAATEASATLNLTQPTLMLDTIVEGTRRVLDFSMTCKASRFLLTSSGAVYGRQPSDVTHVPEDYTGAPDTTRFASAYGEGKRVAELLCALYGQTHGLETSVARCFAFVGPYLPLDGTFAIGNFIRDGLASQPITVNGDGTPYRSYLYAADLAIWLWTLLHRAPVGRAYNVGADEDIPIREVAHHVRRAFADAVPVTIRQTPAHGQPAERYVPSIQRARTELGLLPRIGLEEALRRTIAWNREKAS